MDAAYGGFAAITQRSRDKPAGIELASAVIVGSPPAIVYLGAVVASTAVSTTRPSQAALVPALARQVEELTATNVVVAGVETLGILAAGGGVGLALTFGSVAYVFAAGAALLGSAALLVASVHATATAGATVTRGILALLGSGNAEVWRSSTTRLLVDLLGAEFVVIGALDVLVVVLALDVLHAGQATVGYLNVAYGAGGVLFGTLGVLLVGRRLGPVILTTAVLLGLALALQRPRYQTGEAIVREGKSGDQYFVIVEGRVEILRAGESIAMLSRGDGLGEIALLRDGVRTATAVATTPVSVYALNREAFLTAVTGHAQTLQSATQRVRDLQARDQRRGSLPEPPVP